ncbi:acetyl-CoA carboxylase biotin carboxyl carrier protein subunit [Pedobacter yonginense]|uniref:Acetyl-CoA carboxylase biotin carboxyl carrier protein subunit n=1 Tax=Pedobacter yonginense TaxID=651869 RepID=A0A317ENB6_9SPHI|nr:acetyl-CoA carboxylase biotin carboxyl carrier protein subunit [Pedobacter yonginense]PWS28104.1 acetyl-CoA carboxylase biotin carboxyl carrier protein subunit [Pedobacter yonginense]
MHQVKVNDRFDFEIDNKGNELFINHDLVHLDLSAISDNTTHVIYKNQSFNTELVEINQAEKTCTIKVNGNTYSVKVEDQFDQLLKQLGLDNLATAKVLDVKAPMPGLVLKVIVEEGTEIKKGDNLLILEAMKMENILKSPSDGIVKKISVNQGDKVEKNQVLIQFK